MNRLGKKSDNSETMFVTDKPAVFIMIDRETDQYRRENQEM